MYKIVTLLLLFYSHCAFAQTTFQSTDIDGLWQSAKSGSELFIEISGSTARITSVGTPTLTKRIIGGYIYESIYYNGNGTWAALRNGWIYNSFGGDPEDGHWEKKGPLTLTLSADKNVLTGSGHWTYRRVKKNVVGDSTSGTHPCPTYGFKFGTPSYNCVTLEWWSLSTKVNMIDPSGNFKQSNEPEARSFTIEYRRQGDINWITQTRANTGKNTLMIDGLDACTRYEVQMTASCDNGKVSDPTDLAYFTTACHSPGKITVDGISTHAATVSTERLPPMFTSPCPGEPTTRIRIVEYKSANSGWEEVICNTGSPCILNNLTPATSYRVRARYQYGVSLYSNYTNEVFFTTK